MKDIKKCHKFFISEYNEVKAISEVFMKDLNSIIDSLKGSSSNEQLDKVAKMINSGEAGITPKQAAAMATKIMPMLNKTQQERLKLLLRKLK